MSSPLVSVIIPVYNAQKTIATAIKSLQQQTLQDIEFLLVDDCSNDNTAEIIKTFSETDSRIRYFRMQKNRGPGAARNLGLENAKGSYIGFMDADDIIAPDIFEKLYNSAEGYDIAICGYYDAKLNTKQEADILAETKPEKDTVITDKNEILKSMLYLDKNRLFAFLWNKLYRRELIEEKKFPEEKLNEDYCFNCEVWDALTSVRFITDCLYYYIDYSNGSLSRKYTANYFEIMYNKYLITKKLFDEEDLFTDDIRGIICTMHIKHLLAGFSKLFFKESEFSAKQIKQKIKEVLAHETCTEACQYAKATRKQEWLCNFILSSKNTFLIYVFSKAIYILKNNVKTLFGKLK